MTFGIGQEVSDPDGKLLQLNGLLDGSRTYDEVIPLIATALCIPASDVESFMSRLIDNGHIEDASQGTTLFFLNANKKDIPVKRTIFRGSEKMPSSAIGHPPRFSAKAMSP